MLARANRLVRADDYRNTVRRGRRASTSHALVYTVPRRDATDSRFGFVVSKAVGNAVTRNLIRRRLKSVCRALLPTISANIDMVIRARPGAEQASWSELHDEVASALTESSTPVRKGEG